VREEAIAKLPPKRRNAAREEKNIAERHEADWDERIEIGSGSIAVK
jgi:hypothetical protein